MTALKDAGQVEQFVSLGGPEALEALRAREELEGRTSFKIAVRVPHTGCSVEKRGGGGSDVDQNPRPCPDRPFCMFVCLLPNNRAPSS